jgi:hypothetical protein
VECETPGYWIGSIGSDGLWDGWFHATNDDENPRVLVPPVVR